MSDDEVTTTKSDAERWVPIPEPLVPLLTEAKKRKLPHARIVITSKGRTPTRQNLLNGFRRVQKANHLPRWSVHAFRHFYCSELIRQKVGVEVVRALAGHSSIAITARYLHADSTDMEAARKALSGK